MSNTRLLEIFGEQQLTISTIDDITVEPAKPFAVITTDEDRNVHVTRNDFFNNNFPEVPFSLYITQTGLWTMPEEWLRYPPNTAVEIQLIGAGAGGNSAGTPGGGGGACFEIHTALKNLPREAYITIGKGGAADNPAQNGGDTIAFGEVSQGGRAGTNTVPGVGGIPGGRAGLVNRPVPSYTSQLGAGGLGWFGGGGPNYGLGGNGRGEIAASAGRDGLVRIQLENSKEFTTFSNIVEDKPVPYWFAGRGNIVNPQNIYNYLGLQSNDPEGSSGYTTARIAISPQYQTIPAQYIAFFSKGGMNGGDQAHEVRVTVTYTDNTTQLFNVWRTTTNATTPRNWRYDVLTTLPKPIKFIDFYMWRNSDLDIAGLEVKGLSYLTT